MSERTRVRLRIVGSEFVVSADEDKDYIVKISNMVDEKIKELLRQSDSMSVAMAAILAALNYCDELEKEKIITEELLRRTETSESLASRACSELDQLRVENKRLREEKLGLHKLIDSMQSDTDADKEAVEPEDPPQQLRIPLDDLTQERTVKTEASAATDEIKPEEPAKEQEKIEDARNAEDAKNAEDARNAEDAKKAEDVKKTEDGKSGVQSAPAATMTARQMLEEKRKALLEQKKNNQSGAQNKNRPKPFRPVSSAKSGGGAFPGNGRGEPKINYRDNDKISGSFRRSEFADMTGEEDMLSFFDRR